jgi:hypothetical protein
LLRRYDAVVVIVSGVCAHPQTNSIVAITVSRIKWILLRRIQTRLLALSSAKEFASSSENGDAEDNN